jgi:hypothetical protein
MIVRRRRSDGSYSRPAKQRNKRPQSSILGLSSGFQGTHHGIRTPVLESKLAHIPDGVETLARADIPITTLLDLSEDPRLDEGATCDLKPQIAQAPGSASGDSLLTMMPSMPYVLVISSTDLEVHKERTRLTCCLDVLPVRAIIVSITVAKDGDRGHCRKRGQTSRRDGCVTCGLTIVAFLLFSQRVDAAFDAGWHQINVRETIDS